MMMPRGAFFMFLLVCGQELVWSVRLVELRVPAHERVGGRALLGCQFDMEGEVLYSVKWYKDDKEFFRYVPKNNQPMKAFKRSGVYVDLTRSSSTVVALEKLTRQSAGEYSCEVSGESPSFNTTKSHKKIVIHLLPESGPYVTGAQDSYYLDEEVVMNCSSALSWPKAHIKWLLNGQQVPESYIQGPWYRNPVLGSDASETTLQLRFIVAPQHFVNGAMQLKCQATIAPLYQRETNTTHYIRLPELMFENHEHLVGVSYSRASVLSKYPPKMTVFSLIFAFLMFNVYF